MHTELEALFTSGGTTGTSQTIVGEKVLGTVSSIELNFQLDKNGLLDRNTPLPLKFGWILGFRNGDYVHNLNYVSEGLIDVKGPRYMYLVIDDYNKVDQFSTLGQTETQLLNNYIGSDKLKSRINS